jgi:hypothetical protein
VGEIAYDPFLTAIPISDIVDKADGKVLNEKVLTELAENGDDLIWDYGFTEFPDDKMIEHYSRLKQQDGHRGMALLNGAEEWENIGILELGYPLFLTSDDPTPRIATSIINTAVARKTPLVYFGKPTKVVAKDLAELIKDTPFCHPKKVSALEELMTKFNWRQLEVLLERQP